MSKKSNTKVKKSHTTGQIGTKYELPRQNNRNILPLTDENLNVFNIRYNTSNSSDDDDSETVITDYENNPYGLTTPPSKNNTDNGMDIDDYEPPATELLTREGKQMFHKVNDKMEPVTSSNYNRNLFIYDKYGNEIPRKEHLPEERILSDIMMDENSRGGKRRRRTQRKIMRKTQRKIKRKTRKSRRHTKKYK